MLTRSAKWHLLFFAYCAGLLIGGVTVSGYPPLDPSFWLMAFSLGGIVGLLYPERFES